MSNVIDMVKCPYCERHIVAEAEMVCERCMDKVTVDMCVSEILSSISSLEEVPTDSFEERRELLKQSVKRLQKLLE